jgi:hypothetical protein
MVPHVGSSGTCDQKFEAMDSGNKGYLTEHDFVDGTYGIGGRIGNAPNDATTRFATADKSGNGMLTKSE